MNNELKLLQLIDSASPTGAFSHSFGMETAAKEGKLQDRMDLYNWIMTYLKGSLAPTEGKAVLISRNYVQSYLKDMATVEDFRDLIQELDHRLFLNKIPMEIREASRKIGKRFLENVLTLYPDSEIHHYKKWIKEGLCFGNSAIVHGWVSAFLEINPSSSVFTFLFAGINNQLQSAIRLNVVGQTDAQVILRDVYPMMSDITQEIVDSNPTVHDLFTYSISQEIESMRHEELYSRLFMS